MLYDRESRFVENRVNEAAWLVAKADVKGLIIDGVSGGGLGNGKIDVHGLIVVRMGRKSRKRGLWS
jgi:hypothetical protein